MFNQFIRDLSGLGGHLFDGPGPALGRSSRWAPQFEHLKPTQPAFHPTCYLSLPEEMLSG